MNGLSRSTALKVGAALSFLINGFGVVSSIPAVFAGSAAVNKMPDSPPFVVMLIILLIGVVAIVAAYGTWKGQRWGVVLTIVANLVNGLSAAPGILFAPVPALTVLASFTVLISLVIIALCLWRDRRPMTA